MVKRLINPAPHFAVRQTRKRKKGYFAGDAKGGLVESNFGFVLSITFLSTGQKATCWNYKRISCAFNKFALWVCNSFIKIFICFFIIIKAKDMANVNKKKMGKLFFYCFMVAF